MLMFYLTIVNKKYYVTGTLGWHNSTTDSLRTHDCSNINSIRSGQNKFYSYFILGGGGACLMGVQKSSLMHLALYHARKC